MLKMSPLWFVLLLTGCSSSPLSPTGEAIYYALDVDMRLRTWVDACKSVSPVMRQEAMITRQNWWRRNGDLVEGADFGLAYDLVHISGERAATGARVAMALTWNIVQNAQTEVQARLEDQDSELVCRDIMSQYNLGKFDISNNEKLLQALHDLRSRKTLQGNDLRMKQAEVYRQAKTEYGRAFYVAEKIASRRGCEGGQVQFLKNDWPNEVYSVSCPNKSYLIMRCEWGNCRVAD